MNVLRNWNSKRIQKQIQTEELRQQALLMSTNKSIIRGHEKTIVRSAS